MAPDEGSFLLWKEDAFYGYARVWKPYLNVRSCAVQNGSHEPHVAVEPLKRGSPKRDVL